VQSGHHLRRCMLYIDLNMVRAGAVTHPADWLHLPSRENIYFLLRVC
jgi:putative transposase